jgi:hypothetical protein
LVEKTYLIFAINSIATSVADAACSSVRRTIITPAGTSLPVRTVPGHVTSVATDTANDVSCVVLSLRAIPFAVPNLATVLASLVLIVTKSSVQGSKLSKLVALEFVLAFRDRGSLFTRSIIALLAILGSTTYCLNNIVNQLLSLVDLFFSICHDEAVKIFLLVAGVGSIRTTYAVCRLAHVSGRGIPREMGLTFALFDGALSANSDLGT